MTQFRGFGFSCEVFFLISLRSDKKTGTDKLFNVTCQRYKKRIHSPKLVILVLSDTTQQSALIVKKLPYMFSFDARRSKNSSLIIFFSYNFYFALF